MTTVTSLKNKAVSPVFAVSTKKIMMGDRQEIETSNQNDSSKRYDTGGGYIVLSRSGT
jgi:hypothetical protein